MTEKITEINNEQFRRTEMLIGNEALLKLKNSRVAVFGVGGVGGYICEALIRGGVGALDIIDNDIVAISNLNRQIIATRKTLNKSKVDVMKDRLLDINPEAVITTHECFFLPGNSVEFDFSIYDYVADAVDTVTAKIEIIMCAKEKHVPVISAMGAGNKLDADRFKVTDIYKTEGCPLARVMRRELKKRDVKSLKVVYSDEKQHYENGRMPGSMSYVPGVCGLIMAGEIIKDLIKNGTDDYA